MGLSAPSPAWVFNQFSWQILSGIDGQCPECSGSLVAFAMADTVIQATNAPGKFSVQFECPICGRYSKNWWAYSYKREHRVFVFLPLKKFLLDTLSPTDVVERTTCIYYKSWKTAFKAARRESERQHKERVALGQSYPYFVLDSEGKLQRILLGV